MGVRVPVVDLSFALVGTTVPRDHGYLLYSSLARWNPELHGVRWLGVHPLSGVPSGADILSLPQPAELRIRVPVERLPLVLPLAGRQLQVGDARLTVGVPKVHGLSPAPSLDARMVFIKLTQPRGATETDRSKALPDGRLLEDRYRAELDRQMAALGVQGTLQLCGRRRLTVAGKTIVGFSARVSDLDEAGSIKLQEEGLGGKRAMGCGLFRPTRSADRPTERLV